MADTIASLGIEIDSGPALAAAGALDNLAASAGRVDQSTAGLHAAFQQAVSGLGQQAAATVGATAANREYISVSAQMAAAAERLNQQFDAQYARTQRLAEIERLRAAGLSDTAALNARARAESDYAAQVERLTNAQQGGSTGQRNFQITNASEQLRQFIEQVAYGTPLLQAFSQQVPQALVGFGPWAAVLSIAAAAVGVTVTAIGGLIGSSQQAAEAAKAQTEETDKLLKVLQIGGDTADKFATSLDHLSSSDRGLAVASITSQVQKLTTELNNAKAASDAATSSAAIRVQLGGPNAGGDTAFVAPEFEKASAQVKVLTELYTSGQIKQDTYSAGLHAAGEAAGFTATQTQGLVDTQLHAATAVVELAHGLELATAKQTLLVDPTNAAARAIINQATAIDQAAEALGRYDVAGRQALAQQTAQEIRRQRPGDAGERIATDFLTQQADDERRRQEQIQKERDQAGLISAGQSAAAAARIVTLAGSAADPSGRAGLEQKLNDLQAARTHGIQIEGDYNQRVADIKSQIAKLDDQAAREAQARAEALARPAQELASYETSLQKAVDRAQQQLAAIGKDPASQVRAAGQIAVDQLATPSQKQLQSPFGPTYLADYARAADAVRGLAEAKKYDEQFTAAATEADKALDQERARGLSLLSSLATPEERHRQSLAEINNLYADGAVTLAQRNQLLAEEADKYDRTRLAADRAARQQKISDLYAEGEPGSGVSPGSQALAGLQAGGLELVEQYGNISKQIGSGLADAFNQGSDALTQLLTTGKVNFRELTASILTDLTKLAVEYAIVAGIRAATGVGGAAAGGADFTLPSSGGVIGYAGGTGAAGFTVGGGGAADSKLVQFRASPGERVTVTPPGGVGVGGDGGGVVNLYQTFQVDARGNSNAAQIGGAISTASDLGAAKVADAMVRNPRLRKKLTRAQK
jgi:lambda family phage tail tape measure protein